MQQGELQLDFRLIMRAPRVLSLLGEGITHQSAAAYFAFVAVKQRRSISAPTTIPCIDSISGRQLATRRVSVRLVMVMEDLVGGR
jgi:hypothetical protein